MRIQFETKPPARPAALVVATDADGALLPAAARLDRRLDGALAKAARGFRAKQDEPQILELAAPKGFAAHLLLIRPDRKAIPDARAAEALGARTVRALEALHVATATVFVEPSARDKLPAAEIAAHFALGARLAAYRFDRYRTRPRAEDTGRVEALTLVLGEARNAARLWRKLAPVAAGVELARDLANEPGNVLTPAEFCVRVAAVLAPLGVEVEIVEERKLRKLGMGALMAVGQGSANRPRLLLLRWRGAAGRPVAFVGKGVTFDSGGISIKKAAGMELMKSDMAGAAAVVGLFAALARGKAAVQAVGIAALVENMPAANAFRPGDVVRSFAGKTVEVVDTDAEGRLILIDALAYAVAKFRPVAMVDLATLTYSVVAALGDIYAGMFANDDDLAARLLAASTKSGEKLWRLPLDADYLANLKSPIADLRQCAPDELYADAAHAAAFLGAFVGRTPWAHLDIAGKMAAKDPTTDRNLGAPGYGVRLLAAYVEDLAASG